MMHLYALWVVWYLAMGAFLDQIFMSPSSGIGYGEPQDYDAAGGRMLARALVIGFWPVMVIAIAVRTWD